MFICFLRDGEYQHFTVVHLDSCLNSWHSQHRRSLRPTRQLIRPGGRRSGRMAGDDVRRQIRRFEGHGGVYQGVCGCVGLLQGRKSDPCNQDSG